MRLKIVVYELNYYIAQKAGKILKVLFQTFSYRRIIINFDGK